MTALSIILSIVLGLAINELSDISPWAARRLVAWSARIRYRDPRRAEIRAEELAAVINDRPGKLLKLGTGLRLVCSAVVSRARGLENAPAEGTVNLDDVASSIVDRFLFPTERYRGEWRRHWIHPVKSFAVGLVMAGLAVAAAWRQFRPEYAPWATAAVVVVFLGWAAMRGAGWWGELLVITDRRIISTAGLFRRRVHQLPLARVTDMRYEQSVLGRLLGYGDFRLEGVGRRSQLRRIKDLPNPNELYLRIVEEMYDPGAVEERLRMTDDGGVGRPAVKEPTLAEQVAILAAAVERLNRSTRPPRRRIVRRSAPTAAVVDGAFPPVDGTPLQERLA